MTEFVGEAPATTSQSASSFLRYDRAVSTATGRRGARRAAGAILSCAAALAVPACRRSAAGREAAGPVKGDGLFLAEAPAFVPLPLEQELDAMGIRRIYVPAATLA